MADRWQMNRAGIFNFWYYDDEEFQLSDGRLILRGANGSGKSVTMQSFLPLVLDGDKRPWRLDPFGSRDRRIEYYLLGDVDSGINERTGYLYLEFIHPEQQKTVTVGIGLRARRGVKSLQFWGFAITDQRRIGKDFFLYDVDQYERYGVKVPLQRDKFAFQLGNGGKLVREQAEYRRLVNNVLFGFEDEDAYQELLDLLIQLRSPKLSKDFKPSTIYDILTEALPPLQEEELRPLSEVLEDMDQISDHLDELVIHRKEIERLDDVYTNYNQFLLYEASDAVLSAKKDRDEAEKVTETTQETLAEIDASIERTTTDIQRAEEQQQNAQTEYDLLTKHKAIEKQDELESAKQQLQDIEGQTKAARRRQQDAQERRDNAVNEQKENEEKLSGLNDALQENMSAMEDIARDAEFKDHDLYHRQWETSSPLEESSWKAWKRDMNRHKTSLKEAHQLALQEQQAKDRAQAAEKEMSEAREERDREEQAFREAEKRLEEAISEQETALFQWFQSLEELPLSNENWRSMVHRLQDYPQTSYRSISEPAQQIYEKTRDDWKMNRLKVEHAIHRFQEEKQQVEEELEEWKQKKEPEPERRQARIQGRQVRQEQGEKGAPLYTLCDFQEGISDAEKATIETVLECTGLLDAWISEDETVQWPEGSEEFFIKPSSELFGYTLADVLTATPPEDGWITAERIDQFLRTVHLDGDDTEEGAFWVNEKGRFQFGKLYGQIEAKPQAEFIGKKAREQARLAKITDLEEAITDLNRQIKAEEAKIASIDDGLEKLGQEILSFPEEEPLQTAERARKDASHDLERAQQQLEKRSHEHQEKLQEWRNLREAFAAATEQWTRLNDEAALSAAIDDMQTYQGELSRFEATSTIAATTEQQLARIGTEIEKSSEQLEEEENLLYELEGKKRTSQQKIETLTSLLEELGILDIHEKMESLKKQILELDERLSRLNEEHQQHRVERAKLEERLRLQEEQFERARHQFDQRMEKWKTEWQRGLLPEWKEPVEQTADPDDQQRSDLKHCREIAKYYRKTYDQKSKEAVTNACLDVFAEVKNSLVDYALERYYEEDGERLLIASMRDRQHPAAPAVLKAELVEMEEEQQRLLNEKDRELYEQIIIHSVGKAIRHKIYRAESWVKQMNRLMDERKTSSGLNLSLQWEPRSARNERELDTYQLVTLLKKDPELLREDEIEQMISHFRSRIRWAKQEAEEQDTLRKWITELLDYRSWFDFTLYYKKGDGPRRQLTDSRFNVLSGGEKAMSMYIPLFAATYSRYSDSRPDSPKIISLDEAFAGVDEENMRDMFKLLTDMGFDYMMTSQVLWGCYDTVPSVSIYEILRYNDADYVTLIRYHWDGHMRRMITEEEEPVTE